MPYIVDEPLAEPAQLIADPPDLDPPDLLAALPPYEQASYDIQGTLRVLSNEFARIEQARQSMILNWFPATADALLCFFEWQLGLPIEPANLTLAQRQRLVLAYMRGLASQGSGLEWEATITALLGTTWSYTEHIPGDGSTPPAYEVEILLPYAGPASTPAGLEATPDSTTGALPAGTYYYAVSAATDYGETLVCAPVSAVLGATGEVVLTWTGEGPPATGYNVYRGSTASDLVLLATVTMNAYTDDGTGVPGTQTPPTSDSSGSLLAFQALQLARQVTPAHIELIVGYKQGFIVGVSAIGREPL